MSLLRSVGMFSVIPVRAEPDLRPGDGARALLWLPVVGALLGGLAGLPAAAVRQWAPHANLLGALAAVAVLAGLTRCLHLDGLADTADGLGSRAPAERALEIMRQSDIGPFGVIAVLLVLAADWAALTVLPGDPWAPVVALAVAAATGRVGAVAAAVRTVPAAHRSGFGALVAGRIGPSAVWCWFVVVLLAGAAAAFVTGVPVGWIVVPQVLALLACRLFRHHVVRRLGGITGDVLGALIELGTVLTLIGMALR
jgi:adenosylcobinamide-GDP ribazoletransferase